MKLVVFIPAYNEEKTIAQVIQEIPKEIEGIDDLEILVVDDGSIDNTVAEAKKAGALVASHAKNEGLGIAFSTGIEEALKQKADIVVVGLDRTLTYEKLAKALGCLNNGAILIGANSDPTYPTETGLKPGAGSIIAAIECASGKKAHIVGKPNIYALEIIEKEHGLKANEILVVGDRLGTDIKFANDCGAKSALVLSGVSKKEDIKEIKPNYILDSVLDIQTQHLI